ncbi:MAG: DUF5371 family protein [Archaeoglobaceae archaeon]
MVKIVHAQTVLDEKTLEELKQKTGEKTTKDAITKAIYHYITCSYTHEEPLERRLEEAIQKRNRASTGN